MGRSFLAPWIGDIMVKSLSSVRNSKMSTNRGPVVLLDVERCRGSNPNSRSPLKYAFYYHYSSEYSWVIVASRNGTTNSYHAGEQVQWPDG